MTDDHPSADISQVKPEFDFTPFESQANRVKTEELAISEIREHFTALETAFEPIEHRRLLSQLLEKIAPIDFRAVADLEGEAKLLQKHRVVITIEEILRTARQHDWGLCRRHDFIYLFNGAFWKLLEPEELKGFLGQAAEKLGNDKFDARFHLFQDQLYKQFLAGGNLPQPVLQPDIVLINLKNGTFEIGPVGGQIRDFRRGDFLTYQLPFEYQPDAQAPLFRQYLNRVLPQIELQNMLSEFLAYLFAKHLKLEKCLLLYGSGSNGKSVFFDVVNALLGQSNVSSYSLQSLTQETGYFRANLANKLLNYASEINGKLETAIFKALVSGEPIEARLPYGKPFILKNYARLIFNCNQLPRDVEHTEAYFRRFLIIPFNVTIPETDRDPRLAQKIIENELSGVFNWVLDGLNRLLLRGDFEQSDIIKTALQQYKTESDSVQMFMKDYTYQKSPNNYCLIKDLYVEYRSYCQEDGYRPLNKRNFIARLETIGVLLDRKNIGNIAFLARTEEKI